jgi:hypothetical protein
MVLDAVYLYSLLLLLTEPSAALLGDFVGPARLVLSTLAMMIDGAGTTPTTFTTTQLPWKAFGIRRGPV